MNKEQIKTVAEKAADGVQKTSWPKWAKVVATVGIAAAAALASLYLTSCTVNPAQAAQLQALDTLLHTAAPYVITIEPIKEEVQCTRLRPCGATPRQAKYNVQISK